MSQQMKRAPVVDMMLLTSNFAVVKAAMCVMNSIGYLMILYPNVRQVR